MDVLFSFDSLVQFLPWFLLLGVIGGFLAGLLGIGGGAVLVPGLYSIFSLTGFQHPNIMHICIGTSLAVIVPTGLSSARAHWKKGAVDISLVRHLGIGVLVGVFIGTALAGFLSGVFLKLIFASAIAVLALIMIVNPSRFTLMDDVPAQPWSGIVGGGIGFVSSLIGIGGATMTVPFLSLSSVPIHKAIGTAAALGLVISVPAMIGFVIIGWGEPGLPIFSLGYVSILAWLCIVPVSVLIAPLGVACSHRIPVPLMKKGFAVFMILVAFKMWGSVLG